MIEERKRQKLKEVIDKRKLEHGVGMRNLPNEIEESATKDMLIFKGSEISQVDNERAKKALGKVMQPEIQLINLDEEEDRDKEAINMMMKKYTKLWKNLYYKYSNSGFNSKNVSNFD
jgi:hypothetical protein